MILGKDIKIPEDVEISSVSDGYHTFQELYELSKCSANKGKEWK